MYNQGRYCPFYNMEKHIIEQNYNQPCNNHVVQCKEIYISSAIYQCKQKIKFNEKIYFQYTCNLLRDNLIFINSKKIKNNVNNNNNKCPFIMEVFFTVHFQRPSDLGRYVFLAYLTSFTPILIIKFIYGKINLM